MDIKRFDPSHSQPGTMFECSDGNWASLKDHDAQVTQLTASLAAEQRLRKEDAFAHIKEQIAFQAQVAAIKAQLTELTAALQQTHQWQPIETAPKDGTVVVGALIRGRVRRVSDMAFNRIGWYTQTGDGCHWVTHWTPLPPLPDLGERKV